MDGQAGCERVMFGTMPDGRAVEAITLANADGLTARVLTYGATLQSLTVPDRDGRPVDVTLGYPDLAGYLTGIEYFGATVGRVANRIAGGRFALDGVKYRTPINNGANTLHGGTSGFDRALWTVIATHPGLVPAFTLRHVSPDGDQGFPGTLAIRATFGLDGDTLSIAYEATTDAPTIVNLSNHAYWNLAGEGSSRGALGHRLTIPADAYLPVDAGAIPTGEFRDVAGTPFDFREPRAVGERVRTADPQILIGRGYDHNMVVSRSVSDTPRLIARLEDRASGRTMELSSNQSGLQLYSGNFLDGSAVGKSGHVYRQGAGIALEPQMFPDTPNRPEFGSVRLDPGETYRNVIRYRFST